MRLSAVTVPVTSTSLAVIVVAVTAIVAISVLGLVGGAIQAGRKEKALRRPGKEERQALDRSILRLVARMAFGSSWSFHPRAGGGRVNAELGLRIPSPSMVPPRITMWCSRLEAAGVDQ